jgi:trk system potassium uptake protein TrkA
VYVIVIGGGEVGRFIAEILIEETHEVVIVEPDELTAQRLQASLDVMVVTGSGVSPPTLQSAGISRADLVLAVTPIDEINLVACMIAKKHGPPTLRTVAKVKQSHYVAGDAPFSEDDLDAVDALVHTERAIATIALEMLRFAGSGELRDVAGGRLALVGMLLGSESPLVTDTLASIRTDLPKESIVVAVQNSAGVRIPNGSDRLKVDERAYILTLPKHLTELTILSGQPWQRVHRVLLIGIGNTGFALAQELEAKGFTPTLLEIDHERAERVAARLPRSSVLHGDGTDPDLLRRLIDEHHVDAVVVLLKDPERSLLLGIFAKSLGAKKVVVRCDKPEYAHLANRLGVDAIISKKRAVANAVLRYVSRGRVESTLLLGDEHDAELIDFRIGDAPKRQVTMRPLKDLAFPPNALVAAVLRDGRPFIASGDTVLQPRDELFVVCTPDAIASVEALIE